MGRMNTLSVTFMVVVVLSICFFVYQAAQESDPKQGEGETGKVELAKNISTEAVLADWTQDSYVIEATKTLVSKKERPAVPVLISTSPTGSAGPRTDPLIPAQGPAFPAIPASPNLLIFQTL